MECNYFVSYLKYKQLVSSVSELDKRTANKRGLFFGFEGLFEAEL